MEFNFHEVITTLQSAFRRPLPGWDAQRKMAPASRLSNPEYLKLIPEFKKGSVLLLLYPVNTSPNFILIERASGGVHGSQVALPGGKHESADGTLEFTALRETHEEIGIHPRSVEVIGNLTELFIPASRYMVYPFVGMLNEKPEFILNQEEVHTIIEVPLNEFLNRNRVAEKKFKTSYGLLQAPYFSYRNFEIWGATSMILNEFFTVLKQDMNS